MKKLTKILLINWLYFSKQLIELDDINFLTGKNGAGKSTVIDALQIVLLGELNARNFNKAANENSQRTLDGYLRADMDDKNPRSRKGKDFSSYIVCEYLDDIKGSRFVTGVVFDCRSDGSRREQFFIYNGAIPEDCYIINGLPMEIRELRQYLKGIPDAQAKLYDTQSQYRQDLLAKWNVHKEQAFRMLKKAVSFQPIVDIQKFITENICDAPDRPDIDAMQQNIRDYKRDEELARRQEEKLAQLMQISQYYRDWQAAQDRYQLQRFLVLWAEQEHTQQSITQQENARKDFQAQLLAIQSDIEALNQEKQQAKKRRDQLTADRANSDVYQEQIRLESQQAQLEKEQRALLAQLNRTALDIKREAQSLCKFSEDILCWPSTDQLSALLDAAAALRAAYLPLYDFAYDSFSAQDAVFEQAQSRTSQFAAVLRDTIYTVETCIAELKTQADAYHGTLAKLQRNIKDYPRGLLDLKQALQTALSKELRQPISVEILADVLEIADGQEQWRGAVEGYLHTQKFYLLIPTQAYPHAVAIYDRLKETYPSFGLVDIQKLREREHIDPRPDSLAKKVETSSPLARSYIDYLLGRVVCVPEVSQLRRHQTAITADGMLYQGYVVRPISKARMQDAFIGQKAIALRIQRLKADIAQNKAVQEQWRPIFETLNAKKNREYLFTNRFLQSELPDRKGDLARGGEITAELQSITDKMSHMNLEWLAEMSEQIERLDAQIQSLDDKKDRQIEEQGQIGERMRVLEEKEIPELYTKLAEKEAAIGEQFTENFQKTVGIPRYTQELSRLNLPKVIAKNFGDQLERTAREVQKTQSALHDSRKDYVQTFQPCSFSIDAADNEEFAAEQKKLEESELPNYRKKIQQARESALEQFRNDFLAKLKSSIDQVQEQVKNLNRILKNGQFGTDRYCFLVERNPDYADYYDMITSPDLMEGDGGLFALPFQEKYGPLIEELFRRIATSDDTQLNARKQSELQQNIARYTDFRTYLRFDLETTDQNGNRQLLSKTLNTKSGGETQTPFYIAVLASFAQLYQVNNLSSAMNNTMRLVVFDEAFNKMDSERIIESVKLLRKMNLQAIVCTPPDKLSDIAPLADRTLLVGKRDYAMYVLPYGKEVPESWNEG
jgi:uncharacterized protein YPO0396